MGRRELRPGSVILYGANAHYTHERDVPVIARTMSRSDRTAQGRSTLTP